MRVTAMALLLLRLMVICNALPCFTTWMPEHVRNGAVIARCSQPEISWWGWRNADDEYLVTSIAKACALNPGVKVPGGIPHNGSSDGSEACDADFDSSLTACSGVENAGTPQKLLILDARSYTAAVANRAKGGGCECEGTEG
ncbi:hypothetical protein llap_21877 [Limosa lapponica baueri]|uniref:Myotubularin phosphatase domain-containing protein n=1 Tax=Limosa lapponica baueri TaxID=1758121 RepID=A0A2I0T1Z7_LIMLA|nr:hypothetical protein llap_21877 [Limosa lapponica baueri]